MFGYISKIINNQRGGISPILIYFVGIIMFITFSIYSIEIGSYIRSKNILTKALDYGTLAAVNQIDAENSTGLGKEFNFTTGMASTENVILNDIKAINAFYSIFTENTGVPRSKIEGKTLILTTYPSEIGINYKIYRGSVNNVSSGLVIDPAQFESIINDNFDFLPENESLDSHRIFINGNISTNNFKNSPYFMVFVKNVKIISLLKEKQITLVSFQSSRLFRK